MLPEETEIYDDINDIGISNAFSILLNDDFFGKQFQKIYNTFKENLISFKTIKGFDTYQGGVKNIKRLEKNIQNYGDKLTQLSLELNDKTKIINRTNLPLSEKNKNEIDIAIIAKKIQMLRTQKRREKNKNRKEAYDSKIDKLVELKAAKEAKHKQSLMPFAELEALKANIFDLTKNIDIRTTKFNKIVDELAGIVSQIEEVGKNNNDANELALVSVVDLCKFTASNLLKEYADEDVSPEMQEILEILGSLENTDDTNPVIQYIEDITYDDPEPIEYINPANLQITSIKDIFTDAKNNYKISLDKISKQPILETYHTLYDRISSELLEEAKCTGPTKKASSDRKGKKWTKCARQSDGSYKRIHWGQAGVRVGKHNPKRRKSFRARHKCSSAKPGTPKAAACGDW